MEAADFILEGARASVARVCSASPLTRSSYHAGDDFARLKAARAALLDA